MSQAFVKLGLALCVSTAMASVYSDKSNPIKGKSMYVNPSFQVRTRARFLPAALGDRKPFSTVARKGSSGEMEREGRARGKWGFEGWDGWMDGGEGLGGGMSTPR